MSDPILYSKEHAVTFLAQDLLSTEEEKIISFDAPPARLPSIAQSLTALRCYLYPEAVC
jgi:hypothetical protein